LAVYPREVRVTRSAGDKQDKREGRDTRGLPARGAITRLSEEARRRMLFTFRNVVGLRIMLTLTYPESYPTDGRLVKAHWSAMRHWLTRRGLRGLWFLEFQRRGAPHLHVFLTDKADKREVREAWARIVDSGDPKHLKAGTRIEALRKVYGAAAYAAKYASKMRQKAVPEGFEDVGRFWGAFGGLKPVEIVSVAGPVQALASAVRVVRGLVTSRRKQRGKPGFRDGGCCGWMAWDIAPAMLAYLDRVGLASLPLCKT
jgi:hypothetical protein